MQALIMQFILENNKQSHWVLISKRFSTPSHSLRETTRRGRERFIELIEDSLFLAVHLAAPKPIAGSVI